MHHIKTMLITAAAALAFQAAPASAHHIWIEQNSNVAAFYFGEFNDNLREASPGYLDTFGKPVARLVKGKEIQTLQLHKLDRAYALSRHAAPSESIVVEDQAYPVRETKRDGKTIRTHVVLAARFATDLTTEQSPLTTLDIVPTGNPGEFRVYYQGKPAERTEITLSTASGWEQRVKTGSEGKIKFDMPWQGTYVLRTSQAADKAGSLNGKSFDSTHYSTSLTVTLPSGASAPTAKPTRSPHELP